MRLSLRGAGCATTACVTCHGRDSGSRSMGAAPSMAGTAGTDSQGGMVREHPQECPLAMPGLSPGTRADLSLGSRRLLGHEMQSRVLVTSSTPLPLCPCSLFCHSFGCCCGQRRISQAGVGSLPSSPAVCPDPAASQAPGGLLASGLQQCQAWAAVAGERGPLGDTARWRWPCREGFPGCPAAPRREHPSTTGNVGLAAWLCRMALPRGG